MEIDLLAWVSTDDVIAPATHFWYYDELQSVWALTFLSGQMLSIMWNVM